AVPTANLVSNGSFDGGYSGWTVGSTATTAYFESRDHTGDFGSGSLGVGCFFAPDWKTDPRCTLSQSLSTTAGTTYDITFWTYNTTKSATANFRLLFGGVEVGLGSNAEYKNWVKYSFTVTAQSAKTSLLFYAGNLEGNTVFDDISVVA